MKLQYVEFLTNAALSQKVRDAMPDEQAQDVFRAALNQHLREGHSEPLAYARAYRSLEKLGYQHRDGKWIAKDALAVSDVHVDGPLGGGRKEEKDDPGTVEPELEEIEQEAAEYLEKAGWEDVPQRQASAAEVEYAPWHGVDFDGTLAEHEGDHESMGAPVPEMVDRVKHWLDEGRTVKILTARVADDPDGKQKAAIEAWCQEHIGQKLEVTAQKDPGMTELWDDRAVRVERDTGEVSDQEDIEIAKAGNGVMLSLAIDPPLAEKLAVPGGEAPEDLHITLAYFGHLYEIDIHALPGLEQAVQHFADTHAPVKATLSGLGRFPATPQSDSRDVIYLGVHSPDIQQFRNDLVTLVEATAQLAPKNNFGFNPHITLKYLAPHAPHLIATPEPVEVTFGKVTLSIGSATKEYPLAGGEEVTPAAAEVIEVPEQPSRFEIAGQIVKVDQDQHLVFGWFSVCSVDGRPVIDVQDDIITTETLEACAYEFVLTSRTGGQMHECGKDGQVRGVGRLVESVVFTPQKVAAMVQSLRDQNIDAAIHLPAVAWWGGMYIEDQKVWERVTTGELKAWSIGGRGERNEIG